MKDELRYIGEKITHNAVSIAQNIAKMQGEDYTQRLNEAGMPYPLRLELRTEIIRFFGQALYENLDSVTENVINWSKKSAELAIHYHVSLSDSLRAVSSYRNVIWDVFTEELVQRQFAAITMLDVSKIIDPLLDLVSRIYGELYENHNNRLMDIAYTALEELSVPVVSIVDGIAVIPIVGEIDTHRAKLIMEISLNEGARLKLQNIILDFSGVPMIDTMIADKIFQVVYALRLTGIEAMITGIRPEIVQTIVNLQLNFGNIKTYSTMQKALKHLGVKLVTA
ncbi:MAG: STAS domain-containing protein [Bacillota bacterium]|nr:STAS domain-containing protein [Bacillota bacterium]